MTTELEDGTIVIIEDEYHADRRAAQQKVEGKPPRADSPPILYPDTPENKALAEAEKKKGFIGPARKPEEEEEDENVTIREKNERAQLEQNLRHPDPEAVDQRPISRAERRRLIKEELRRLSHVEVEGNGYQRRVW